MENEIKTPYFRVQLDADWQWITLKRSGQDAYRIRFAKGNQIYSIDVDVITNNAESAQALAEKKYEINHHSAFNDENIPPFQYIKQVADLVAWGCRYRWVDGGDAPYKFQEAFVEIGENVIHFSYAAEPEFFDQGLLVFNQVVRSIKPINR